MIFIVQSCPVTFHQQFQHRVDNFFLQIKNKIKIFSLVIIRKKNKVLYIFTAIFGFFAAGLDEAGIISAGIASSSELTILFFGITCFFR